MNTLLAIKKLALLGIICAPAPVTYVAHDKIRPAVERVKQKITKRKPSVRRSYKPIAPPCVPISGTGYAVPLAPSIAPPERPIEELPTSAHFFREPERVLPTVRFDGPTFGFPPGIPGGGIIVYVPPVTPPPVIQPPAAIPEPATWATMVLGFGVMGLIARRRVEVLA